MSFKGRTWDFGSQNIGSIPVTSTKYFNMDIEEFSKQFLINRDETGRFIVKSLKTGKIYFIECIDGYDRTSWGDYNPITKDFETSNYGKYKGSIKPEESMITEKVGFDKIYELKLGESPLSFIDRLEDIK